MATLKQRSILSKVTPRYSAPTTPKATQPWCRLATLAGDSRRAKAIQGRFSTWNSW